MQSLAIVNVGRKSARRVELRAFDKLGRGVANSFAASRIWSGLRVTENASEVGNRYFKTLAGLDLPRL